MSQKTAKNTSSDALWESQKSTILHLYLSEDKPLKEVIDIMNSQNFPASKSQYERYFKKWAIRKNLKSHEWKAVHHHSSKRKRDGKESDLYVDGILISRKKFQKETSRHGFVPMWERQIQAPSPKVPNGLLICTPGAEEMDWFQTANLPWFRFEPFLEFQATRILESATRNAVCPGSCSPSTTAAAPGQVLPLSGDFLSTFHITEESRLAMLNSVSHNRGDSFVGSFQFVSSKLLSFMPESHEGEHFSNAQKMLEPINEGARLQLAKLTIYLLSNNLSTALSGGGDKIFRWLHLEKNFLALRFLLSIKEPTAEALAEALFRSAIKAEDSQVMKILLDSGLNPNEQIIDDFGLLYTPLQYVSKKGNIELARILIKADGDVNDATGQCDGKTALQLAAASRTPELLTILISKGAKINATDVYGRSALQEAASNDDVASVHVLVSAGANVDSVDDNGRTALHEAADFADDGYYLDVVATLLSAGANVNATTKYGLTALDIALEYGTPPELVYLLLDAHPQDFGTALCYAAVHRDIEMVDTLLKADAKIDSCLFGGRTALTEAALMNDIRLVSLLLNKGADVNGFSSKWTRAQALTPLQAASHHKGSLLAQILLNAGANAHDTASEYTDNDDDDDMPLAGTALQIAAHNGNKELVKILLDAGANVNAAAPNYGYTALEAAVISRNATLVSMLLNNGANINADAGKAGGRTALQAAVEMGGDNLIIVQCLLDAGADGDGFAAVIDGTTALTAAIEGGDMNMVHIVLDAGADINNHSAREWGITALDMATATGNIPLVRLLLRMGADANDPAALSTAVDKENAKLVGILLAARPKLDHYPCKRYGSTALQAAVKYCHTEIVRILLDAGVDVNSPASECSKAQLRRYSHSWGRDICYGAIALEIAVDEDDEFVAQMLLAAEADPNIVTGSIRNESVLVTATSKGNLPLVEILLEAGADLNKPATGEFGRTALQMAAEKGHLDLVKLFLKSGADVNAAPCCKGGVTALQAAAIGGYFGIARILINANADVNAAPAQEDGRTALEGAVEHGRIDTLQLLLDAGAGIQGPGRVQYDRALELGARQGHHAACRLLRSYHASRYGDL